MAVRPLSPVLLEQGRGETCEDPCYVQYDQYAVGVVDVLHQLVGIDQPVNGDPDAQQHHGEFQGRFEGVVDDVVHPVVRAGDKRLMTFLPSRESSFTTTNAPITMSMETTHVWTVFPQISYSNIFRSVLNYLFNLLFMSPLLPSGFLQWRMPRGFFLIRRFNFYAFGDKFARFRNENLVEDEDDNS